MSEEAAVRIAKALEGIGDAIEVITMCAICFGFVLLVYAIVDCFR